jgi:hypothetical protein
MSQDYLCDMFKEVCKYNVKTYFDDEKRPINIGRNIML